MEPRLQNNQVQMWTSTSSCFIFFTLPLVAGPLAILGHTLGIYAELLLRSWCLAKHALLMASPKSLIRGLQILMGQFLKITYYLVVHAKVIYVCINIKNAMKS